MGRVGDMTVSDDELARADPHLCRHGWSRLHPQPCPECEMTGTERVLAWRDARERELADHYRRMWPVVIVLAALGLWAGGWLFVYLSGIVYSASSVWAP